jgi:hypothetical protein
MAIKVTSRRRGWWNLTRKSPKFPVAMAIQPWLLIEVNYTSSAEVEKVSWDEQI